MVKKLPMAKVRVEKRRVSRGRGFGYVKADTLGDVRKAKGT